jgi:hypothetical protein
LSAVDTLLSPVILFFVLGALAAAVRSDLSVPEPIAKGMSLYLMAAIGLKGGVQALLSRFLPLHCCAVGVGLIGSILGLLRHIMDRSALSPL